MFKNTRKRAMRRGWPIHGYVGSNGSGKSAAMVWDSLPTLEAGRPVLSTVRLLDYLNPRPCEGYRNDPTEGGAEVECGYCAAVADPVAELRSHMQAHPLWIPFTDWEQLLEATKCDVLMDEVTGVASSRESHAMPAPVANGLVQMRRADVVIRWSAPNWARADKIIREVSQAVTYCTGFMPKRATDEDGERAWRNRRMFEYKTYDAADFEDFTVGKREQLKSMIHDWHYGPRSPAFKAYDTLDAVLTIGTVTEGGSCYRCGGRRTRPECSCPDYVASRPDKGTAGRARKARSAEDAASPTAAARGGRNGHQLADEPTHTNGTGSHRGHAANATH